MGFSHGAWCPESGACPICMYVCMYVCMNEYVYIAYKRPTALCGADRHELVATVPLIFQKSVYTDSDFIVHVLFP